MFAVFELRGHVHASVSASPTGFDTTSASFFLSSIPSSA